MLTQFLIGQVDTVPAVNPGETVNTLIDAAQSAHWALIIGSVLCLIVWIIRKYVWTQANPKILPWLAVGIGVCGGAGFALIENPSAWINAILLGINGGVAAAGSWGLLGVVRKK